MFLEYFDQTLDKGSTALVQQHISRCPECLKQLGRMRAMLESLGKLTPAQPPADFTELVSRRVSQRRELDRFLDKLTRRPQVRVMIAACLVAAVAISLTRLAPFGSHRRLELAKADFAAEKSALRAKALGAKYSVLTAVASRQIGLAKAQNEMSQRGGSNLAEETGLAVNSYTASAGNHKDENRELAFLPQKNELGGDSRTSAVETETLGVSGALEQSQYSAGRDTEYTTSAQQSSPARTIKVYAKDPQESIQKIQAYLKGENITIESVRQAQGNSVITISAGQAMAGTLEERLAALNIGSIFPAPRLSVAPALDSMSVMHRGGPEEKVYDFEAARNAEVTTEVNTEVSTEINIEVYSADREPFRYSQ
jgi:hypothetical protein